MSPTFPAISAAETRGTVQSPSSDVRSPYRTEFGNKTGNIAPPVVSTIMPERRYRTPMERPVAHSTINEGGIVG